MKASLQQGVSAKAVLALLMIPLTAGCGGAGGWLPGGTSITGAGPTPQQSLTADSRGPVRKGYDYVKGGVTSAFGSQKQPEVAPATPDNLSLSQTANPGPDLWVKFAQVAERSGNFQGAESQYQRALKQDPSHLDALLGYARMQDRQGRFGQAQQLYQEAVKRHPQNATACNDLGLCLARKGELAGAAQQITRAVELQPEKPLYRNNLATILVQLGRTGEALEHLSHVHPPAVAHYNLGFLLRQRGDRAGAQQQFARALQADPTFTAARHYVQEGGGAPAPAVAKAVTAPAGVQPTAHRQPATTPGAALSPGSTPYPEIN
jgi:Flp pilus assembly protein TadD